MVAKKPKQDAIVTFIYSMMFAAAALAAGLVYFIRQ